MKPSPSGHFCWNLLLQQPYRRVLDVNAEIGYVSTLSKPLYLGVKRMLQSTHHGLRYEIFITSLGPGVRMIASAYSIDQQQLKMLCYFSL